jgi:hypothetical protein
VHDTSVTLTPEPARQLDLDLPLSAAQAAAVRAWNAVWAEAARTREATKLRELRIDLDRRLSALERQAEVVRGAARSGAGAVAVLVVHRDERAGQRLADAVRAVALDDGAVVVTDNGADAAGAAVLGQPRLVVVDVPILMMTPRDVVQDVRRYAPGALVAACADGGGAAALRSAGADATYRRGASPADLAALLAAELAPGSGEVPAPRP